MVLDHYFSLFEQEDNKEVIEKTLECLREMCEVFGPAAIANHTDKIVQILLALLDKKAYCQVKGAGSGENGQKDEDEDAEED